MGLRVSLDLHQWNSAKRQLMKSASDLWWFLTLTLDRVWPRPGRCTKCDANTWFSGLTQIYITEILLKDSWQNLKVIYNEFLLSQEKKKTVLLLKLNSLGVGQPPTALSIGHGSLFHIFSCYRHLTVSRRRDGQLRGDKQFTDRSTAGKKDKSV
jgi:hypothetical protein